MAYITLKELKKILPGILDQWIDKDDESWEWIFQEIEQSCYAGKPYKGKKWKKYVEEDISGFHSDICDLNDWLKELDKKYDVIKFDELKKIKKEIMVLNTKMDVIRSEAKEAKLVAQTAKQRTEVDYSKYSGKSDGKINYCNPEDKDCKSCKYYSNTEVIKNPCSACEAYQYWEAKDE